MTLVVKLMEDLLKIPGIIEKPPGSRFLSFNQIFTSVCRPYKWDKSANKFTVSTTNSFCQVAGIIILHLFYCFATTAVLFLPEKGQIDFKNAVLHLAMSSASLVMIYFVCFHCISNKSMTHFLNSAL